MDGKALARWTRFAVKGGIGKCTAVQDCIAESPEDLMFLKDDEITVLLQLPSETEEDSYLGYCEGVVGRFHGSHVRLHGKLKRAVKTKRQSTSAMSSASTPVQSATPSPRGPLSPLTISMPNSGSTPELARDSTSFSNPFDLEFDSSLEVRDDSVGDEERVSRRTRTADDLPGLEMFLPRSRSGSRSRPSSLNPDRKIRSRNSSQHPSPLVKSLNPPPSPPPGPSPLSQSHPSSPKMDAVIAQVEGKPVDEVLPTHTINETEILRVTSPLGNESEAESSHLYDAASVRSSFYSVNSYRSSVIGNNNLQIDHGRQRLSKAEIDDGGLGMGIGLSMLQDFGDDEDEDFDVTRTLPVPEEEEALQVLPVTNDLAMEVDDHTDEARQSEELEPKSAQAATFEDNVDHEGSEVLSDDESYWDGGDIYDNYRYSRYSMMTKGSKRKSRFSMMSRNSTYMESPKSEVPPLPKDPDGLLLAESPSRLFFNSPPTEKKKIPPPLSLTSEAHVESTLLSPNNIRHSDASPSRYSASDIASPQPSPLLHTSFPSPTTSSDHGMSVGRYSDIPDHSPSPSALNFSGAASSLRQRLEGDHPPTPTTLADKSPETSDFLRTRESVASVPVGGGIVIEDNDEVNVTVVLADEEGNSKIDDSNARESFQSVASQSTVTSVASDMTDMSQALRKFENDLATMMPSDDLEDDQSDFIAATTPTTTQPLRLRSVSQAQTETEQQVEQPGLQVVPPRSVSTQASQVPPTPRSGLLRPDLSPFMPHPNAPRPNPAVMSGQRVSIYGMPPVHDLNPSAQVAIIPVNVHALHSTLREAAAHRIGPVGVPHRPTIYGKTVVDLNSADGPVPMTWSLRPFPPDAPSAPGSPAIGGKPLRRAPTSGSSPLSQAVIAAGNPLALAAGKPPLVVPGVRGPPQIFPGPSQSSVLVRAPSAGPGLNPHVISRPNFSPQVGGARPRSRSFSGFDRAQASQPVPGIPQAPQLEERKPSRSTSIQSLKEGVKQSSRHDSGSFSSGRSIVPSPLSQSQGSSPPTSARSMSISKGQPSPLGRTSFSSSQTELLKSQTNSDINTPRRPSLSVTAVRQVQSVEQLKFRGSEDSLVKPPSTIFEPVRRNSNPAEPPSSSVASPPTTSTPMGQSPIQRLRRLSSPTSSRMHQRTVSQQSQASSTSDLRSTLTSPVGDKVPTTIKTRLSLAHLRIRSSTIREGSDTQSPSTSTAPGTPVYEIDNQSIRVQDAEFEIVRPAMMRRMSSEPTSDSSIMERDDRASLLQESRVESPVAGSIRSMLSPIPASATTESPIVPPSPVQPTEDASIHRAREQKWMTAMSSTPAAQARKSKKIRRLVIEGVPSSLRYLVWGHLTDSKSRRIPGVYGAFGKRVNVNGKEAIERDAARCFPGQPHLQDSKGPLVGLLKTYTILVPDLDYQSSLALVAGHLLLQSPEEDGFWTFVAMMDIQLRAYYSPKSVQLEADAIVFAKACEALFPSLHRKLFLEHGIPPLEVCRMWFPSLFSATLPQKYTNRIWDVYFCEGPPFIFRVALALLSLSRTAIESSRDRTSVQALIAKPEVMSLLPDDPEELISMALGIKVKDDDIMKQRVKFESQLRQQQQSQSTPRSAPRLLSSISLPRPKASLQS